MNRRFALVDVNNMYVSCERIFRPDLENKPMVVLSNNDGCVVARCSFVKSLKIPMSEPWFKIKDIAKAHGIIAYSSNYELYADISNRIMSLLGHYTPYQEIYSIDESFLDFTGMPQPLSDYAQSIREQIRKWIGVPICVGIGSTKTRAKLANYVAKKRSEWNGVCDLEMLSPHGMDALLNSIPVGEVWGIGRRLSLALNDLGVTTVKHFYNADPASIRQRFSVTLERTLLELRGISCIDLERMPASKQQIISSRSFGRPVYLIDDLKEAVMQYVSTASAKLRRQHSVAAGIQVYIQSNPHKATDAQYSKGMTIPLSEPTDDTIKLIKAALLGLRHIYQPGIAYAKAGVMLVEIGSKEQCQRGLFSEETDSRREALMSVLDKINQRYGKNTLGVGITGLADPRKWSMKRQSKSPAYTTRWDELPIVYAQ